MAPAISLVWLGAWAYIALASVCAYATWRDARRAGEAPHWRWSDWLRLLLVGPLLLVWVTVCAALASEPSPVTVLGVMVLGTLVLGGVLFGVVLLPLGVR